MGVIQADIWTPALKMKWCKWYRVASNNYVFYSVRHVIIIDERRLWQHYQTANNVLL